LTFDQNVEIKNLNLKEYLEKKNYILRTKKLLEADKPIIGYFLQKNNFGLSLEK